MVFSVEARVEVGCKSLRSINWKKEPSLPLEGVIICF